uniref:Uncharacterized protein n=1 Tax=Peronospora matthiolae TaxID=2874970 RepID=A0AAV1UK33_9STRA
MRHFVFLAVFVAAFVTLGGSFTGAATVATTSEEDAKDTAVDSTKIAEKRAVSGAQGEQVDKKGAGEERGNNPFAGLFSRFRGKAHVEGTPSVAKSVAQSELKPQVANVAQQVGKQPRSIWGKIFIALKLIAGVGFAASVYAAVYGLGGMIMDHF